jgi:hypothetical protein
MARFEHRKGLGKSPKGSGQESAPNLQHKEVL